MQKKQTEVEIDPKFEEAKVAIEKAKKAVQDEQTRTLAVKKILAESKDEKEKAANKKSFDEAVKKYEAKKDALEKVRIEQAQDGDYLPEERQRGSFHVEIEKVRFDVNSGKRLSKSTIQMFAPKAYKNFVKYSHSIGYTITVKWNPIIYTL